MRDDGPATQQEYEISAAAGGKAPRLVTHLHRAALLAAGTAAERAELVTQSVRVFRLNGSARPA